MFPFWDVAIAPLLAAVRPERVVEIGALRGENTVQLLEALGADTELHVIDPIPAFDPSEHEREFPGRYIFHRDISHSVLPELPPVDVALIDGDHNWYTVYHELRMLAETARRNAAPLPVLMLHDVCWPYGRRDLYYAPERIPEEFRQPYAQRGIRLKGKKLVPRKGGLNPEMNNALEEGGPRNGVMTALDDFIAEQARPLRRVVIPIYFGLAIVAEEERLERQPELAQLLDALEGVETRQDLLELAEEVRLRAMIFQHNVFHNSQSRADEAAERYLHLLKGTLLDDHYLENELRLEHLAGCIAAGTEPDLGRLRDPVRNTPNLFRELQEARAGGTAEDAPWFFAYASMGRYRLDHLDDCLDTVRAEAVTGDLVECGTGRGGGAMFLRGYLDAHGMPGPTVWVADRFTSAAWPARTGPGDDLVTAVSSLGPDLNTVRDGFGRLGLLDDRVRFLQGDPAETLPVSAIDKIALLRIDSNAGVNPGAVLDALYDRVTVGGFVVVEHGSDVAARAAVEDWCSARDLTERPEIVDHYAVYWRKTTTPRPVDPTERVGSTARRSHPPLAPVATAPKELSVVVVFYNMRREAARTLHSLTRSYQREIEDLDYEVIVIDNGSEPEQRLGSDLVRSFGPEFRYIDMGPGAPSSPAPALNRGIAESTGATVALMIDGAHVLTPGVLHHGMVADDAYGPAVVATQQWYVGPGQQGDAMMAGYDQDAEDRLFDAIDWPADGYGLFDIGHFIGERDWFDGIWESNCVFVPRSLLEQLGGVDESFSMPGGGFANLDYYERMAATPDVRLATILGEGSFHQLHGGTTTNQAGPDQRHGRIGSYFEHYEALRGRVFRGPGKTMHYIGTMRPSARRTRGRRLTGERFAKAEQYGPDAKPTDPSPIPEDLRFGFIDAYWRSLAWQDTKWLGVPVHKCPVDLVAYQEALVRAEPDWIIEIGTGASSGAHFLATICELLGRGQVLSVGTRRDNWRHEHGRLTRVEGEILDAETIAQVTDLVGRPANAMVIFARARRRRLLEAFESYSPLIPVGSYAVFEETVVNGHPVWPSFGLGPNEAVRDLLRGRRDFVPDPTLERHGLTFDPSGFLRRRQ